MGGRGDGGQQGRALNPPVPAQSQTWQWSNGKEYRTDNEMPGNGARGGSCAALTHDSGECPLPVPGSSAWARPAFPLQIPSPWRAAVGTAGARPRQPPACLSRRFLSVVQ